MTSLSCQACRSCGDSVASRLEDISQQLASLTTILVGAEDDSQDDNSSHCSVLRKLAAESEESGEDQLELDSYLEGLGHPGQLGSQQELREKSVMRELTDDDTGDAGLAPQPAQRKLNRDMYYERHQALTCNQQFLQFMHKTLC